MTLEEKLSHFRDATVNNAKEESDKIFAEYVAAIEREFQEHVKEKDAAVEAEIKVEMAAAKREMNRELLARDLEYKKRLSQKEKELKDNLFEAVKAELIKQKSEPTYLDYLCEKIQEADAFAAGDDMIIYVDPSDKDLVPAISNRTNITPQISTMEFIGGIRAVIRSKNILIDDSYKTFIDETKNEFVFKDLNA